MNVGLPGTGIGGLFYLLTALLMPVVEVIQTLRGKSSVDRWQLVIRQTVLAGGIIAGLFATGWLLNHTLPHSARVSLHVAANRTTRALGVTPTLLTLSTLAGILIGVELLRPLAWWKDRFNHQP